MKAGSKDRIEIS